MRARTRAAVRGHCPHDARAVARSCGLRGPPAEAGRVMTPLRMPFRFKEIWRRHGRRPFAILDIGAGNHSASVFKRWFPNAHYTGIDLDRTYNNDERDFAAMDEFFEMDLTRLRFGAIPD